MYVLKINTKKGPKEIRNPGKAKTSCIIFFYVVRVVDEEKKHHTILITTSEFIAIRAECTINQAIVEMHRYDKRVEQVDLSV